MMLRKFFLLLLLARAWAQLPDWENPAVFERNQLATHVPLVPYGSIADALRNDPALSPWQQSLNGVWKIYWTEVVEQSPDDFYLPGYSVIDWPDITVPGNWQTQGFGHAKFRNVRHPFPADPPRVPKNDSPVGCYRRTFQIPENWLGREIFLLFYGVHSASTVWINGREVGYNEGGMEPAEYDVTGHVRAGENTLAVRVHQWSDGSYLEDQDMWRLSGIFRDVILYALPRPCIRDCFIKTDLTTNYQDAELQIECLLANFQPQPITGLLLEARLYDADQKTAFNQPVVLSLAELAGKSEKKIVFTQQVLRPFLWSAEKPYLYQLVLSLHDHENKLLQVAQQRFGFREIEICDRAILINGRAVKFNGVNSHMQHPVLGHAMDRETILKDLTLMKQFNINCVRTSHYPPEPLYLDLADELGMYIVDEVGDECHITEFLSSDPLWRDVFLERGRRLIQRDKNHPSVVIWSAGNEAGPGPNIAAVIEQGKKMDPTRPWLYGGNQEPLPFEDIIGPRYPLPADLEILALEPPQVDNRPSFMDEYVAATGNSLGMLDEFWHLIRKYRRLSGGAIWDWTSPGLLTPVIMTPDHSKNRIPTAVMGRPQFTAGRFGQGLALSGHDDWVETYQDPRLDLENTPLFLELWLFPRRWNGNGTFITKGIRQFSLFQCHQDSLEFYIFDKNFISLKAPVPQNWVDQWHHLAAGYDGEKMQIFVDGQLVAERMYKGAINRSPYPLAIGKNSELHGQEHDGYLCNAIIDEVRVYNRTLSHDELLRDIKNAGDHGALLYLPFEEMQQQGEFYSLGIGGRSYGLIWPDRRVQPELYQLKKSAQPVKVQPNDLVIGRVRIFNHYQFTNLNELTTTWQLQADDVTIQKGALALQIAPGDSQMVHIPFKQVNSEPGVEYRLLLTFSLPRATRWAAAGHEVAFAQFELDHLNKPVIPTQRTCPPLKAIETGTTITIQGANFSYTFEKTTGRWQSMIFQNKEYLIKGPAVNVWRAPLANETDDWGPRMDRPWYAEGLDRLLQTVISVSLNSTKHQEPVIHVSAFLNNHNQESKFKVEYDYTVTGDGVLLSTVTMTPLGKQPEWLPKMGLQMELPNSMNRLRWYGRGPFETYPDRKTGAKIGIYRGTVQEQYSPYLVPQDYGNKTDVRWAAVCDSTGVGLLIVPEKPFNFSAQHISTDRLTRSRYPFQLLPAPFITVNIDAAVTGVGETPHAALLPYRTLPQPLKLRVFFKPVNCTSEVVMAESKKIILFPPPPPSRSKAPR